MGEECLRIEVSGGFGNGGTKWRMIREKRRERRRGAGRGFDPTNIQRHVFRIGFLAQRLEFGLVFGLGMF